MKLTDQQKQGIRNLYGDDSAGATSAIEKVESKKGKFRFFNEDGSVNVSREDFEKKINKESKPSVKVSSDEVTTAIIEKLNEARTEIRRMKDLKDYTKINTAFKNAYDELKGKKDSLKQAEIERIDAEIAELQERKRKLTEERTAQQ